MEVLRADGAVGQVNHACARKARVASCGNYEHAPQYLPVHCQSLSCF
jgi:hypothetical protein